MFKMFKRKKKVVKWILYENDKGEQLIRVDSIVSIIKDTDGKQVIINLQGYAGSSINFHIDSLDHVNSLYDVLFKLITGDDCIKIVWVKGGFKKGDA